MGTIEREYYEGLIAELRIALEELCDVADAWVVSASGGEVIDRARAILNQQNVEDDGSA